RLVEVRERGADRGGGGAHGGKALAHRVHAADRGERGLHGAGAAERVGGLERGGDELVERDALRRAQTHVALDLAPRPAPPHRRKLVRHGAAPGRGGGLASGLTWGGLARGRLARGGIGAPALAAGVIFSALPPPPPRLAGGRGRPRSRRGATPPVAVKPGRLPLVARAVKLLAHGRRPL